VPGRAAGVLLPRRLVLPGKEIRNRVELTYVTPLYGAFTKPTASAALGGLLAEKGVGLVTEFNTGRVDTSGRKPRLVSWDEREVPSTWPWWCRCTAAPDM
jgi:hypothetical protein